MVEEEFEQTVVPEEELTEELNKKKPVPRMTYVSSDGTIDPQAEEDPRKTMVHRIAELRKAPIRDYYIPIIGKPAVKDCKMVREEITPRGDSIGIILEIPQWEEQYNTKMYGIDRRYGIIYAIEDGEWGRVVTSCGLSPQKELEEEGAEKIIAGVKSPEDVKSPESQAGIPMAESTRKKEGFHRVTIKNLGASHSDIDTIGFTESSTDAATSSEENAKIQKEIEEAEKANEALEEERLKIEKERLGMIKKQNELAKERLLEVKKRRVEVIKAIVKESETLQKQKELTMELRRKERSNIYHRMTHQLALEERHFDEYLEGLEGPERAGSEVLTHESDMASDWALPKQGEEPKIALLWAEYAKIESHLHCLNQEFKHLEEAKETTVGHYVEYGRRKERIEKKLGDLKKIIYQYQDEKDEKERIRLIHEDPENPVYLKNGVDLRDGGVYCIYCNKKDHSSYPYCLYCKTHEHAQNECTKGPKIQEEKASQLGTKEETPTSQKEKENYKSNQTPW